MFDVFQDVNRTEAYARLRTMLAQYTDGYKVDLITPLLHEWSADPDAGRSKVAADVWKSCDISSLPMWLRESEANHERKIGTISKSGPYSLALAPSVARYFVEHRCRLDMKAASHADAAVGRFLKRHSSERLMPLDVSVASGMFDGRSGLGWPVCSSNPNYRSVLLRFSEMILAGHEEMAECFPAILGSRNQSNGRGKLAKVRAIFQCSRVIGNLEKCIQVPVMQSLRHSGPFAAWNGRADVDFAITRMFQRDKGVVLSLDFSNFDASVPNEVLTRQFKILTNWFIPEATALIRLIERAFMRTGVIVPSADGTYEFKGVDRRGGIPSGSVLTNLVGSMVNIWAIAYASVRCGETITDLLVQGDDGVYQFGRWPDVGALSQVLLEDLGMEMHVEKNFVDDGEIHFLQNIHRRSYIVRGLNVGVRPIMRILAGMLGYERFTPGWNGYLDSIRWIQQIDNALRHPCFGAFVEWLSCHDRNLHMPVAEIIDAAGGMGVVISKLGAAPLGSNKTPVQDIAKSSAANMLKAINDGTLR